MALPLALRGHTLLSSFAVYGDSTAAANGATGAPFFWYNVLANGFSPVLSVSANGSPGQNSTQMLAGIIADTANALRWHICMDLPNFPGESAATWLQNMSDAITSQPQYRTFIMPPAQDVGGSSPVVAAAQAGLLTMPIFIGRTLNAEQQAVYLAQAANPANRTGDNRHFNDAGNAMQAATIKSWLIQNNWLPGAVPV